MINLLLILAITFVGFVDAQEIKEPYMIERLEIKPIIYRVVCIQDYVFIETFDGGLTQMMREGDEGARLVPMQPMKCEDYKKTS